MFSGQDEGMAVLTRCLQEGCSDDEVMQHLLNARRFFLSGRPAAVNWRPLKNFSWGSKSLKQIRPKYKGDPPLSASTQGLFFHAHWNCIWGLSKPLGAEASQWVLVEVKTENDELGGKLLEVSPRYSNVEEINQVSKLTLREMLAEIGSLGRGWVTSCENRLIAYKAIADTFEAEDAILRELERQAVERVNLAIQQCREGDFSGFPILMGLDGYSRKHIYRVTDDEFAEWRSLAGI